MEENAQQKFETLKEQILEAQYDGLLKRSIKKASETALYQMSISSLPSSVRFTRDHFVRVLVEERCSRLTIITQPQPYWL